MSYSAAEAIVCAGGKQALFNVALALYEAGDEVITHAPGWPTLVEQVRFADADPLVVRTHPEDAFALDPTAVLDALTPRTKAIVINSPCNPTGAVIPEATLEPIVDAACARGIWIVLDLCYERFIYDQTPPNLPKLLSDRMPDRSVLVGSLSKSYAMTGWRCGWALAPESLVSVCGVIQSHSTSNVSSITQHAGIAALTGPQDCVTAMRDEYRDRRDQVLRWLRDEPRITCVEPAGTFYLFPDVSAFLSADGLRTSSEFAAALLREMHVALTAGEAFDAPGFVRISCAASIDRLREGIDRFRAFIVSLDRGEVGTSVHPA